MIDEETMEKKLRLLGAVVAPESSFVENVMSRVMQTHIAPTRQSVFQGIKMFPATKRIAVATVCLSVLALLTTWPFRWHSEQGVDGWWLGSASVFAQELVTVLDNAQPRGVTMRSQTTFIMTDGSRDVSSTVSNYSVSHDRYRCDIFDDGKLRETQWYISNADGLTQTCVRFKSHDYQIDKHPKPAKVIDHVARLREIVSAIDRADRRLGLEEIDGRKCVGFEIATAKIDGPHEKDISRIWFNVETKLPVRIESENSNMDDTPAFAHGIRGMINTLDQFDWSPQFPANTFAPVIPDEFGEADSEQNPTVYRDDEE